MTNKSRPARPQTGAKGRRLLAAAAAVLSLCCLVAAPARANGGQNGRPAAGHPPHQSPPAVAGKEIEIDGLKVTLPDLALLDQEGRKVRFYSDLIKGKVVVLTFFYTSCHYVCTMQGTVFSKLQSLLGERLGKSVFLISVTTDPVTDSPRRLKAWGERYQVKPGWTLVTGEEAEMNKLLPQFTGSRAGKGMHGAVTFIGDDRKGVWVSTGGVPAPEDLFDAAVAMSQDAAGTTRPASPHGRGHLRLSRGAPRTGRLSRSGPRRGGGRLKEVVAVR